MQIKYQKQDCKCLTECPFKMQVLKTKAITMVGSQGCDSCTFNDDNDMEKMVVDCGFRREVEGRR